MNTSSKKVGKDERRTRRINFFYICLKDKTALNYFCENVMYLITHLAFGHETLLLTYLIKMENEIKFANIFKSSVKRFYKNLLLDVIIEYATRDQDIMQTWIKSRIPSSLSAPSTTKTKWRVA